MKILITGAHGFIGSNLLYQLRNDGFNDIITFNHDNTFDELAADLAQADFVFHLAGINRPKDPKDFYAGNRDLTTKIVEILTKQAQRHVPVLLASSIQADLDNDYGKSKKAAETAVFAYGQQTQTPVYVFRLSNLFGKWGRPNYNSVVATFCYNLARDLPIKVNDPNHQIVLNYIDDVVNTFISVMKSGTQATDKYLSVPNEHPITLGELAAKLTAFAKNRQTLVMPSLATDLDKELYGTYLSYLPDDDLAYPLNKKSDKRGWLAEFIKSTANGQIFISTTHPGITRGNHWHQTKTEKFLVLSGNGVVHLRKVGTDKVLSYPVDGTHPQPVDIPTGYVHNIENTGNTDMITLFWASEIFDPDHPDTYYEEV
ncbi:MAG: NAD-dependent epimerase/dehydratase family protein [Candidatus Paralactobacillus gallistercoris]|uniref:NAD-dependent epimerase/dehydratase family protein n=1 Tax=Candidatus Paralactobacillus gallistercoris TaxID=2838724 RepID=A0A948X3P8_9LACO|nr:NAD-dependent epimerase/dehydratase family protein [Candidatus Paralactobacillus gallistercoris]